MENYELHAMSFEESKKFFTYLTFPSMEAANAIRHLYPLWKFEQVFGLKWPVIYRVSRPYINIPSKEIVIKKNVKPNPAKRHKLPYQC